MRSTHLFFVCLYSKLQYLFTLVSVKSDSKVLVYCQSVTSLKFTFPYNQRVNQSGGTVYHFVAHCAIYLAEVFLLLVKRVRHD